MSEPLQFVDLGALHREVRGEIDAAIARVLERSAFIGGAEVAAFESAFAQYVGTPHAIGVANGTDALELALRAFDLPPGSGVIVPASTFIATAEAVVAAGHRCLFADVDPATGLLDLEDAERLAPEAAALIVVHLYGRLADMAPVTGLAARHGLRLLEDAAQAHGARRGGRHAGTFGDAGTFSFYPGKNLGAIGDGGIVVTGDTDVADRVRLLRDHGRSGHDTHEVVGRNSRLDGLQAAVLGAKLPHLDRWIAARRGVAEAYRAALDPALLDWTGDGHPEAESHHLFPVLLDDRDDVAAALRRHGIPTGVHYRVPVPCTPAFGCEIGRFPAAEARGERQLSLPIHPHLSYADVLRIAGAVTAGTGVPA
jgi:dTDP-4-amino-4,6-dideoxygalactose transaminase